MAVCHSFAFAVLVAASASAATPRFARLGAFEGSVEVQLEAADSWRPAILNLPLTEGTRIRTGPGATLEIELDDTSAFRMVGEGLAELSDYTRLSGGQRITVLSLDHGLAYFTGEPNASSSIDLLVPGMQVALRQGSRVRLQALSDASEIAILEGAIQFTIPSAEMELHQGQAARVSLADAAHFSLFREIAPLEPDHWSEQLDKVEADGPASSLDLDRSGKWVKAGDYGTVWQPEAQAGWAPFRDGRWIWYQSMGFTWVGAESWGWKPYHQGRWLQHSDLGWVWVPPANEDDARFLPGEVFWTRATNLAAWGPLAPGEPWAGAGPPRQFAAFNMTGGAFVAGAREIVASNPQDLPKVLKALAFTAALPSPPLPVARLTAGRDALRTRSFSAVPVTPEVQQPVSEVAPAAPPETAVAANVAPPNPMPDAPVPTEAVDANTTPAPIVPGIIVVRAPSPPKPIELLALGARESRELYSQWFQGYSAARIHFEPATAHEALSQLEHGEIDFMLADTPVGDVKTPLFYFPAAASRAAAIYNLPGISESLKLTPEAIAGIYLGEIRFWDDRRIAVANRHGSLPHAPITLVIRSDASRATYALTSYLSSFNAVWQQKIGTVSKIPNGSAKGDSGVAAAVRGTPYSVGFVDYAWAIRNSPSQFAAIRNSAGAFVIPGADSYPIASFTYVVTPQRIPAYSKRIAIQALLNWMISAGQRNMAGSGYAPLSSDVVLKEQRQIALIKP